MSQPAATAASGASPQKAPLATPIMSAAQRDRRCLIELGGRKLTMVIGAGCAERVSATGTIASDASMAEIMKLPPSLIG